jgi:hypothetical protein
VLIKERTNSAIVKGKIMRRRGRGNNRKPGHHHHHQGRNPTFDSNGPGVRLRGTAHQIYEKYLTLGRDAAASGDRIMSENYFQHADHYCRIILANQGPLEHHVERHDGGDVDQAPDASGFGQGEQPSMGEGQGQPAFAGPAPQAQGFNGAGGNQATNLPGEPPRGEGDAPQGGQGQHHGFRRDRFNRRFRDRGDRHGQHGDQGPDRREHRDGDRGNRQPRQHEEEAFEPPAFLKAERPTSEPPPRDPFNGDDEQR